MKLRTVTALLVVLSLGTAACGDDGDSASRDDDTTVSSQRPEGEPVAGGMLRFAAYSPLQGFDPLVVAQGGYTGGTELAAVYDVLFRYNGETREYEPQTAESIEPNDDFTEWTLKIKPGITFTDGTPYDAEAVAFSINRHRAGQPNTPPCEELRACPRNTRQTAGLVAVISDVQVVDPLTVRVALAEPYASFPYVLTTEVGMVPSPTALQAACQPTEAPTDCSYNTSPVGAGAFTVGSFKPEESVTLVRNPDYWDGEVYLEEVVFTSRSDGGGTTTFDAFRTGEADAAFIQDQQVVHTAEEEDIPRLSWRLYGGRLLLINTGIEVTCTGGQPAPTCTGKPDGPTRTSPPTASVKVRQAIAAAVDAELLNERVFDGLAIPSKALVGASFPWYPDVEGPAYDLERAKELVAEAKAEGWDGKVRYLGKNNPAEIAEGVALQAMLGAAGIELVVDNTPDQAAFVQQVIVNKDFDMAGWALSSTPDDGAESSISTNLLSTSPGNRIGYRNPAFDEAIRELRSAATDDEKVEAYRKLSEIVRDDVPVLPLVDTQNVILLAPELHGVKPTTRYVVLLDDAWFGEA
jgi:peptide/nickel transport system substrate-binding protein